MAVAALCDAGMPQLVEERPDARFRSFRNSPIFIIPNLPRHLPQHMMIVRHAGVEGRPIFFCLLPFAFCLFARCYNPQVVPPCVPR